jgi:ABC-2 type transport system permease protein
MRELLLVLRWKLAAVLKGSTPLRGNTLLRVSVSVLIFGGFAVGMYLASRAVTTYMLDTAGVGMFLFHRFISMLLYVFFVTVNVGNVVVCYATLYRSEEVGFLMSMPISHAKIFLVKFVDNFFYSSSTFAIVGLSALFGYGAYFEASWYFYLVTSLCVLLPLMVIAGVLAVMTLMGLIKIAARIGVRVLIAGIVLAYLGIVYLYFQATNPVMLVSQVMKRSGEVNEYLGSLDPPFVRYFPNHWASEFLYFTMTGNPERALPYLIILVLTMVGLIVVAGLMARKFYYRTWLTASDARALTGYAQPLFRAKFLLFGKSSPFLQAVLGRNPQTEALFKRDFWLFFREPSQWLHLVLVFMFIMIFLFAIGSLELDPVKPLIKSTAFLVIFLFNCFLIASVALRFVFPAMSLESDCFWAVRTSPLPLDGLYFHKLRYSAALTFVLLETLLLGSLALVAEDMYLRIVGAVCGGFVAVTLTSLHLGAGTYFAIFREKNPVRIASSHGASLAFLLSIVYLSVIVTVLVLPLYNYFLLVPFAPDRARSWLYVPVVVVAALSLIVSLASTKIGLRAMTRDF